MIGEPYMVRLASDAIAPGASATFTERPDFPLFLYRVAIPREIAPSFQVDSLRFNDALVHVGPVPAAFYVPHESRHHPYSGLEEAQEQFQKAWDLMKDGGAGGALGSALLGELAKKVAEAQRIEAERRWDEQQARVGHLDFFVREGVEIAIKVTNRSDRPARFVCVLVASRIAGVAA